MALFSGLVPLPQNHVMPQVLGDPRWAGKYGIDADFVALEDSQARAHLPSGLKGRRRELIDGCRVLRPGVCREGGNCRGQ